MYSQTIEAALSRGLDQPHKKGLGDVVPLLMQPSKQLWSVVRWRVILPESPPKLSPHLLNGVEVGTVCWPCHAVDSCLLHEGVDPSD